MPLIKCPECGKEISDRAMTCPNCGYPISRREETIRQNEYHTTSISDQQKQKSPTRKRLKIILSICGCILLIGIANSIFSDSSKPEDKKTTIEQTMPKEEIPVVPDTAEPETSQIEEPQPEINETNNSEGTQNSVVDAFKQGFEDNFNISEENQENIDSIQESISEIVNDEDVQKAYEGWKESLNKLFGGE